MTTTNTPDIPGEQLDRLAAAVGPADVVALVRDSHGEWRAQTSRIKGNTHHQLGGAIDALIRRLEQPATAHLMRSNRSAAA